MREHEKRLIDLDKLDSIEDTFIWLEDLVKASCHETDAAKTKPSAARFSARLLCWMSENYQGNPTVGEAAEAMAVSRSTITHSLREDTGKTFSQHLASVRIREAKRLLAYTDLSLSEIASRCGFSDQSYFTKVFRREINLTPGQFRRMLTRTTL